jgi:CubicO group peptidase (beta-lactamase class C family)
MSRRIVLSIVWLALMLFVSGGLAVPVVSAGDQPQPGYAGRLETYLQAQMKTYQIPGLAVAIVRDGKLQYINGLGKANSHGDRVTADTPFLLASVSKSITAVGIMQLVEAGKLRLDAPVTEYLPWFKMGGSGGAITVANLLYQTSGLPEIEGQNAHLRRDAPDALEAGVRDLARVSLHFKPGSNWEYSNLNYDILGLIIQQVSGQRYEDYITAHIFTPLEMQHSFTSMAAARAGGAASGYYPFFGIPVNYDRWMLYSRASLPAFGLWSSAADMSHYLIAQLNGGLYGAGRLLSSAGIQQTHIPGFMFDDVQGYAMGWANNKGFMQPEALQKTHSELINAGKLTVLFHEGDWANYKSLSFMIPEINYGMILLMNTNNPSVTSAFRYFGWDIALIATGGEAQYFQPTESFVVRYARLLFGAVALALAGLLVFTLARNSTLRRAPAAVAILMLAASIIVSVALLGFIFLRLLPENAVNLPVLMRSMPDVGLLVILITLLSLAWIAASAALFAKHLNQRRNVDTMVQANEFYLK